MADDIVIDPATFTAAASGVESAQADLQGAYADFQAVLAGLGDFLGNDDAGRQLKEDYEPAAEQFRTAMDKLVHQDLPNLATSLRNDGASWTNADTTPFGY